MTAAGLIMRRGLRAQWEALIAEHNGDPWYAGEAGKAACKRWSRSAPPSAAPTTGARWAPRCTRSRPWSIVGRTPTAPDRGDRGRHRRLRNGLDAGRCRDRPRSRSSSPSCSTTAQVAGTFDRLVTVPGVRSAARSPTSRPAPTSATRGRSIAVQLAAYAHGDAIYGQGPAPDGSRGRARCRCPPSTRSNGLIMWLNAGERPRSSCSWSISSRGWQAFEQSMWTREWRNAEVSIAARRATSTAGAAGGVGGTLRIGGRGDRSRRNSTPPVDPLAASEPGSMDCRASRRRRSSATRPGRLHRAAAGWLQERIDVIGQCTTSPETTSARRGPPDLPTLRSSTDAHAGAISTVIEQLLDDVESAALDPVRGVEPTDGSGGATAPPVPQHHHHHHHRSNHHDRLHPALRPRELAQRQVHATSATAYAGPHHRHGRAPADRPSTAAPSDVQRRHTADAVGHHDRADATATRSRCTPRAASTRPPAARASRCCRRSAPRSRGRGAAPSTSAASSPSPTPGLRTSPAGSRRSSTRPSTARRRRDTSVPVDLFSS